MQHASFVNAVASCDMDAIASSVSRFRQSVRCLRMNKMLTASTPTHPEPPTRFGLKFTFDHTELVNALNQDSTRFVVHHGDCVARRDICMVRLLDEHLMPFLPKTRGFFPLNRAVLADIFSHRVRNWSQLGRGTGAIRLLSHGGWINDRVLNECVTRNFGGTIVAPIELVPSYEELAEVAGASEDCIVFGLRPAYVDHERLVPALIDGVKPWAAGEGSGVPHTAILLAWRARAAVPHRQIAEYLDIVADRLTEDALVIEKIGKTVAIRSRSVEALWEGNSAPHPNLVLPTNT